MLGEKAAEETQEPDPLIEETIKMIVEAGQASASFIQRRFKIGYARASRLMDKMEEMGIVSAYEENKPRQVLIKKMPNQTEVNKNGYGI